MILVVGGAGYIGSHTLKALNKANFQTLTLDDLSMGHEDAVTGAFVHGSCGDASLLMRIFTEHKITAVMHFASSIFVGESVTNPAKYYANNIANTLTLLEAMRQAEVKNFVFSSTAAVFGEPTRIPIKEDDAKAPINPYGFTKYVVEQALQDYDKAYGLKSMVLRYFNAAGADSEGVLSERHTPETHLIPLVLMAISSGKPLNVFGTDYATKDGTAIRDYIHIDDLASAHVLALQKLLKTHVSNQFNLGSGNGYSVKEIIEACENVTGKKVPVNFAPRRAGDPPVLITDNSKAREGLGWQPRITKLEEIVRSAAKWF